MKSLFSEIRSAVMSVLVLTVVCCGLYPLVVWGIAQLAFHDKANGSLIVDANGVVRGSQLLGQSFAGEEYFHPRPSAAGANGYDAASSSGSNLGPTSQKLKDAITDRIAQYRQENGLNENESVPADAVTASGSGLDPHISVRNAELQTLRVAQARNLSVEKVRELIRANTDSADFGFLGEPAVNVLKLNRALNELPKAVNVTRSATFQSDVSTKRYVQITPKNGFQWRLKNRQQAKWKRTKYSESNLSLALRLK